MYKLFRRLQARLFHYLAKLMYPDYQDRACAFAGEAGDIYSVICFRNGNPLERLIITPHEDGGYVVHAVCVHEELRDAAQ